MVSLHKGIWLSNENKQITARHNKNRSYTHNGERGQTWKVHLLSDSINLKLKIRQANNLECSKIGQTSWVSWLCIWHVTMNWTFFLRTSQGIRRLGGELGHMAYLWTSAGMMTSSTFSHILLGCFHTVIHLVKKNSRFCWARLGFLKNFVFFNFIKFLIDFKEEGRRIER